MGKITRDVMHLNRKQYHKCLLSSKLHKCEDAFIMIYYLKKVQGVYAIYFGCYQCSHSKTSSLIGYIDMSSLHTRIHPEFEHMVKRKKD